jgi:AmiR/NasT family two-component response regulator
VTTDNDYNEANRHLLAAAVLMAPTGTEQEAFGRMCNEAYHQRASAKAVTQDLLGALLDGVRHGNWPA